MPYTSQALPALIEQAAHLLREERACLAHMKQLLTKFLGDETWIPCGALEAPDDIDIFAPPQPEPEFSHVRSMQGRPDEALLLMDHAQPHAEDHVSDAPAAAALGEESNVTPAGIEAAQSPPAEDAPEMQRLSGDDNVSEEPPAAAEPRPAVVKAEPTGDEGERDIVDERDRPGGDLQANNTDKSALTMDLNVTTEAATNDKLGTSRGNDTEHKAAQDDDEMDGVERAPSSPIERRGDTGDTNNKFGGERSNTPMEPASAPQDSKTQDDEPMPDAARATAAAPEEPESTEPAPTSALTQSLNASAPAPAGEAAGAAAAAEQNPTSQGPIHRMTTRRQAQAASDQQQPHDQGAQGSSKEHALPYSPPTSPLGGGGGGHRPVSPLDNQDGRSGNQHNDMDSSLTDMGIIHPIFLVRTAAAYPDRDFGLPPDQAEETRNLLMLYVQKQEEVCRGINRLYTGLLKAMRMRDHVLNAAKAEEHQGEMSDGEDWYDKQAWRLDADLKKGQEEENDDANGNGGNGNGGGHIGSNMGAGRLGAHLAGTGAAVTIGGGIAGNAGNAGGNGGGPGGAGGGGGGGGGGATGLGIGGVGNGAGNGGGATHANNGGGGGTTNAASAATPGAANGSQRQKTRNRR